MSLNVTPEETDAVDAEAAVWVARLHADDRSEMDERAFRAWVAAAPKNKRAFDHMTAVWDTAGALRRNPYGAVEEAGPVARPSRRKWLLGGVAAALAAGGGFSWQAAFAGVYETEVGEQKHVALDDGSALFLDADTKLRVRYSGTRREVTLVRGRCNFAVVADPGRPFVVIAAGKQIVAPQATFDVRSEAKGLQVVCIRGAVAVKADGGSAPGGSGTIKAGERMLAPAAATLHIDRPDMGTLVSWQTGQLVFDGEPLAEAVDEMNRYSSTKLVLVDPRLAGRKLSGVYRAGDNLAFARSVAQLFDLKAEPVGAEIRVGLAT